MKVTYTLLRLWLVFILEIVGMGATHADTTTVSKLLTDYSQIRNSAQAYFTQVGYLPASISELIELNLLEDKPYQAFSLLYANGAVSVYISASSEVLSSLQNYILESTIDSEKGLLIASISIDQEASTKAQEQTQENHMSIIFCSNLYCQKY